MTKKVILTASLAAILSMSTLFWAYGQERSITSVPLSFSWDGEPKGGELVGTVQADSSSKEFTVEGAEYTKRDDQWNYGEQPVAEVELSANTDYRFSSTNRGVFSISGCNARFQSARIEDDGSTMILQVSFPSIDGALPAVTAVSWDGDTAVWDGVAGAGSYEVQLYRNDKLLTTQTSKEASLDLSSYINVEGDYTFSVRAAGSYRSQSGSWSERSEARTILYEDAWHIANGEWEKKPNGWRYVYKNGAYPVSTWRCINEAWYFFNEEGYMESDCYVKSSHQELYYWVGSDGVWDTAKDTSVPEDGARIGR